MCKMSLFLDLKFFEMSRFESKIAKKDNFKKEKKNYFGVSQKTLMVSITVKCKINRVKFKIKPNFFNEIY